MTKIFLKDLTFEEIIKRLQDGEAVYSTVYDDKECYWKMVQGIVCYHGKRGKWFIGDAISTKNEELYFEEAEEFKITEKGFYRTRDGRKAYVFYNADEDDETYPFYAVITGCYEIQYYSLEGRADKGCECPEDLVAKWED